MFDSQSDPNMTQMNTGSSVFKPNQCFASLVVMENSDYFSAVQLV